MVAELASMRARGGESACKYATVTANLGSKVSGERIDAAGHGLYMAAHGPVVQHPSLDENSRRSPQP